MQPVRFISPASLVVVILGVIAATLIRLSLDPYLGDRHIFSWYYVAVILAAGHGGWRCAMGSLLLGIVAADWFFLEPRMSFDFAEVQTDDLIGMCCFLLVGIAIMALSETSRKARQSDLTRFVRLSPERRPPWSSFEPTELRAVADAVRRHRLSSRDLWMYLVGLNASQNVLSLAIQLEILDLPPHDLAGRLERLAQ